MTAALAPGAMPAFYEEELICNFGPALGLNVVLKGPWHLTFAGVLALAGCNLYDLDEPDEPDKPCAIERTALLLPQKSSWNLQDPASPFEFRLVGDRLLYQLGGTTGFGADTFIDSLCSDQTERLIAAEEGLRFSFIGSSSVGSILFAEDAEGRLHVGDRLDEPGVDGARALKNYPKLSSQPDVQRSREALGQIGYLVVDTQGDPAAQPQRAAGLGSLRETLWSFGAEPEAEAALLAEDVVQHLMGSELRLGEVLVHTDDGGVAWVHLTKLSRTPVREAVRWLTLHRSFLVLQVIGDGVAEEVLLRDLSTGEERHLATNTDAAVSFGLDPTRPSTGT